MKDKTNENIKINTFVKYFLVVHIWVINTNFLAEIRSSYHTRGIR